MASKVQVAEMTDRRRSAVASLASAGKSHTDIARDLLAHGILNPQTGKPYSRQTIRADMRVPRPATMKPLAETIGQWTYVKPLWNARILLTVDTTFKDYVFWDALRRGTAPGYEISGPAFSKPVAEIIASYALSGGMSASLMDAALPKNLEKFSVNEDGKPTKNLKNASRGVQRANPKQAQSGQNKTNGNGKGPMQPLGPIMPPPTPKSPDANDPVAYTNAQIARFCERMQGFFQTVVVDTYCLGNQYVIVNPDCTLAIVSPETVTVEYSASDYRTPLRYIIRTKMEKAKVEDIYTADKRTLIIHFYDQRGTQTYEFENLIGRLPIVHFVCDRSANEIYGRPVYEAALPIMRHYDDLILKTIDGVDLLGNPIPVIEGLDNPGETLAQNSDQRTYVDDNGETHTEMLLRFNREAGMVLGKGANAKLLAPPVGFTKDSLDMLRQLFLLLLNHTRVPEVVWGGAIASSKASAETQMPPFIQYIKFRRTQLEGEGADPALGIEAKGGFQELFDIWLRTYKLLNPTIVVGPVRIDWPEIELANDILKYQWGSFLASTGKLSDEDTIRLAGYFKDAQAVVARARGERQRPPKFDSYDDKLDLARLESLRGEVDKVDNESFPRYSTDWTQPSFEGEDEIPLEVAGAVYWPGLAGGAGS